jgi:hypothetical protein
VLLARGGAALLGFAAVFTVIGHPLLRLVAGMALALSFATVYSYPNTDYLIGGYLAAVGVWVAVVVVRTLRAAFPDASYVIRQLLSR